ALAIAGTILVMAALAIAYYGRPPSVDPSSLAQRTAQVDVPPPAPPETVITDPAPERPTTEKPAPPQTAVGPPSPPAVAAQPPVPAPRRIESPAEAKEKKSPEAPAPSIGKTVAATVARIERVKGDVRAWGPVNGDRRASEGLDLSPGERLATLDKE